MPAKRAGKASKGIKAKGAKASVKATAPVGRKPAGSDARLPPVGTTIEKRDRHGEVRCSCTVEADGIKYNGQLYSSLSGAAMAAAKDLGLTNKTQNGFIFWGLSKPPRPAADPVEALQRAWPRFYERAKAAVGAATDDNKARLAKELGKQAEVIAALTKRVVARAQCSVVRKPQPASAPDGIRGYGRDAA